MYVLPLVITTKTKTRLQIRKGSKFYTRRPDENYKKNETYQRITSAPPGQIQRSAAEWSCTCCIHFACLMVVYPSPRSKICRPLYSKRSLWMQYRQQEEPPDDLLLYYNSLFLGGTKHLRSVAHIFKWQYILPSAVARSSRTSYQRKKNLFTFIFKAQLPTWWRGFSLTNIHNLKWFGCY